MYELTIKIFCNKTQEQRTWLDLHKKHTHDNKKNYIDCAYCDSNIIGFTITLGVPHSALDYGQDEEAKICSNQNRNKSFYKHSFAQLYYFTFPLPMGFMKNTLMLEFKLFSVHFTINRHLKSANNTPRTWKWLRLKMLLILGVLGLNIAKTQ